MKMSSIVSILYGFAELREFNGLGRGPKLFRFVGPIWGTLGSRCFERHIDILLPKKSQSKKLARYRENG